MNKTFICGLFLVIVPLFSQESTTEIIEKLIISNNIEQQLLMDLEKRDPGFTETKPYLIKLLLQEKKAKKAIRLLKKIDHYWNKTNAARDIVSQLIEKYKHSQRWQERALICQSLGELGETAYEAIPMLIAADAYRTGSIFDGPYRKTLNKIMPQWKDSLIAHRTILVILKSTPYSIYASAEKIISTIRSIDPNWTSLPEVRKAIPNIVAGFESGHASVAQTSIKILRKIEPNWAQLPVVQNALDSLLRKNLDYYGKAAAAVAENMGNAVDERHTPTLIRICKNQPNYDIIATLGNMKSHSKEIVPLLVNAFHSEDNNLQNAALVGLTSIKEVPHEIFMEVMSKLKNTNFVGYRVLGALQQTKNPKAIPFLIKALKAKDARFRFEVVTTLTGFGIVPKKAIPIIEKVIQTDENKWRRQSMIDALTKIRRDSTQYKNKEKSQQIIEHRQKKVAPQKTQSNPQHFSRNKNSPMARISQLEIALATVHNLMQPAPICYTACKSLPNLKIDFSLWSTEKRTQVIRSLLQVLEQHPNWFVRFKAAKMAYNIGITKEFVDDFVLQLNSEPQIRAYIIKTLANLRKGAESTLVPILMNTTHNNWIIRDAALEAVQKMTPNWHQSLSDAQIIIHFIEVIRNAKGVVAEIATANIRKIDLEPHSDEIALHLMDLFSQKQKNIRQVLTAIDTDAVTIVPLLASIASDTPWDLKHQVILTLQSMQKIPIAPLIEMATDTQSISEIAFWFSSRKVNTKEARAFMRNALNNPQISNRNMIVEYLGKVRDHKSLLKIVSCLNVDDYSTRSRAIDAIGNFGPSAKKYATVPLIVIKTQDSGLGRQADKALSKICPNWNTPEIVKQVIPKLVPGIAQANSYRRKKTLEFLRELDPNWTQSLGAQKGLAPAVVDYIYLSEYSKKGLSEIFAKINPQWVKLGKQEYIRTIDKIKNSQRFYEYMTSTTNLKKLNPLIKQYIAVLEKNLTQKSLYNKTMQDLKDLNNSLQQVQKQATNAYNTQRNTENLSNYAQTKWPIIFATLEEIAIPIQNLLEKKK
ncbi:HEAT repeat domain-containing protein [Candidatus Uabimicrobium sp. HlEnr_7]|uniref:HEAT repeat domain-containing protein n=1 Tax=Candidatus Uabimicrobium helgolandensis TaxID=3095367 RepID=UPI00355793FE